MGNVCLYHRDADGFCAAAIVQKRYPEIELISIQYGESIPWEKLSGNYVVMVDFSLQPWGEMLRLMKDVTHLVWIDHHQTAFDELRTYIQSKEVNVVNFKTRLHLLEDRMEAFLEIGRSGCELAWEYFFSSNPEPAIVHHIGRYDVWDHSDPVTKDVRAGLLAQDIDPKGSSAELWWRWVLEEDTYQGRQGPLFRDLVKEGQVIRGFQRKEWARSCRYVRIIELDRVQFPWEGVGRNTNLRLAVLNSAGNSEIFESIPASSYDIGVLFQWTGNHWKVGLYTLATDIDVGALAKLYGGGGHRKAAGFEASWIPIWLLPPIRQELRTGVITSEPK